MINRAFLVIAAGFVFAFASPSYATYWSSYRGGDGYNNRSGENHNWNKRDRDGDRDRQRSNKRSNKWSWDCDWVIEWDRDCDDEGNRWGDKDRNRRNRDRDSRCNDSWFDCEDKQWDINCDWDWKDCDDRKWSWDCDWDWKDCRDRKPPRCDNPVPEPATAGLACMGMGALTALTRRRRK